MPTEAEVRADDLALPDAAPDGHALATQPDNEEFESRETKIRNAAYARYERRGSQAGDAVEDWLEAERTVDARTSTWDDSSTPSSP
jgi:hypothetical protein